MLPILAISEALSRLHRRRILQLNAHFAGNCELHVHHSNVLCIFRTYAPFSTKFTVGQSSREETDVAKCHKIFIGFLNRANSEILMNMMYTDLTNTDSTLFKNV